MFLCDYTGDDDEFNFYRATHAKRNILSALPTVCDWVNLAIQIWLNNCSYRRFRPIRFDVAMGTTREKHQLLPLEYSLNILGPFIWCPLIFCYSLYLFWQPLLFSLFILAAPANGSKQIEHWDTSSSGQCSKSTLCPHGRKTTLSSLVTFILGVSHLCGLSSTTNE